MRQRKEMAYEGIVTLVLTVNRETGELQTEPQISANGVRGFDESNGFINSAQVAIAAAFANASNAQRADSSLLKEYLRLELKRFIQRETGSRPVITPMLLQI